MGLWVCHACKMIGDGVSASLHGKSTGHKIEELSEEVTAAVRAEQGFNPDPAPTAADFIAYAHFRRRAGARI